MFPVRRRDRIAPVATALVILAGLVVLTLAVRAFAVLAIVVAVWLVFDLIDGRRRRGGQVPR